jgi:hypothetical protein
VRSEAFKKSGDCFLDEKQNGSDVFVVADERETVEQRVQVSHVRTGRQRCAVLEITKH